MATLTGCKGFEDLSGLSRKEAYIDGLMTITPLQSTYNQGDEIILKIEIPAKFNKNKETFILEFLSDILSKRKLIDKKMNITAYYDYTKLYEETRGKNKRKYKNSFLNKINNLFIVKSNYSFCNYLY